jgi:addiction module HigA family antidote
MKEIKIPNIHPGEILFEEFMKPLNLSQYRVAKELCVSPRRINEIVHGKRSISADTALRLSRFYGTSPQFWLNLQMRFDLENEKEKSQGRIEGEIHPFSKKAA